PLNNQPRDPNPARRAMTLGGRADDSAITASTSRCGDSKSANVRYRRFRLTGTGSTAVIANLLRCRSMCTIAPNVTSSFVGQFRNDRRLPRLVVKYLDRRVNRLTLASSCCLEFEFPDVSPHVEPLAGPQIRMIDSRRSEEHTS